MRARLTSSVVICYLFFKIKNLHKTYVTQLDTYTNRNYIHAFLSKCLNLTRRLAGVDGSEDKSRPSTGFVIAGPIPII